MLPCKPRPVKILHVVGGMVVGGIETWLMHVLRNIDRSNYHFDFLTHTTKPCFYDEEIRALGGRVIPCLSPSKPFSYARNFFRILKENGPYHVIHSHVHYFSGITMLLAHLGGVPVRIAHSHTDTSSYEGRAGFLRQCYLYAMRCMIQCHATKGVGCSAPAALDLFGKTWEEDTRWQLFYCGIDFEPFSCFVERNDVRRELCIPSDAFVVGHVGRFTEVKNHSFLLDIFYEIVCRLPNSRLLLVGDGPLREEIRRKIHRLRLSDKVILTGLRQDVPRLMMGAMDVFVFPSHYEGLPLTLVEAQAAGLGCVYSNTITREIAVISSLLRPTPLVEPASVWADIVIAERRCSIKPIKQVFELVNGSQFSIVQCLNRLKKMYEF